MLGVADSGELFLIVIWHLSPCGLPMVNFDKDLSSDSDIGGSRLYC